MTTIVTKTVGATGRDFADLKAFATWLQSQNLVTNDWVVYAYVYDSQASGILSNVSFAPSAYDASHYCIIRPAPGSGVADLDTSGALDYGTTGVEIVDGGFYISNGVEMTGFRIKLINHGINVYRLANSASYPNNLFDCGLTKCRILNQLPSTSSYTPINIGTYASYSRVWDNVIITDNTVAAKTPLVVGAYGNVSRNTFVMRNAAVGTTAISWSGYSGATLQDNVIIDAGTAPVTLTTAVPTACSNNFSNTAFSAGTPTGFTVNTTVALLQNKATDVRPATGGPLIGAASSKAVQTADVRGNNRGTSPDVGAAQLNPAPPLPTYSPTGTVTGQSVTITGAASNATSATVALVANGNGAISQAAQTVSATSGYATATFSNVPAGDYILTSSVTGAGGTVNNPNQTLEILGVAGGGNPSEAAAVGTAYTLNITTGTFAATPHGRVYATRRLPATAAAVGVTGYGPQLLNMPYVYVSPTGSDSTGTGTAAKPYQTIQKGANALTSGGTVLLMSGNYTGGLLMTNSGTSARSLIFRSQTKWGAKIVPPASGTKTALWELRGNYVEVHDIQIDGSNDPQNIITIGLSFGGSNCIAQGNWVHHVGVNAPCTSQGGAGIDCSMYYGGVNIQYLNNLVHDIGPFPCAWNHGLYHASTGKIKNNLVYHCGGAGIHLWHDANTIDIINNTVCDNGVGIVVGAGSAYKTSGIADNVHVHNNIIMHNSGVAVTEQGTTGPNNTYLNNLLYANGSTWDLDTGKTNVATVYSDPQVVSYVYGSSVNFHLKSTSPAIGKGTSNLAPSTDYDGNARPSGSGYDIGAFEYVQAAGTNNYTLPITAGTVGVTGRAPALKHSYILPVSRGATLITANQVALTSTRTVFSPSTAAVTVKGNAATLTKRASTKKLYIKTPDPTGGTTNYEGYVFWNTALSGAIDITADVRCRQQMRATSPYNYETPKVRFAITGGGSSPLINYVFQLEPTLFQLVRQNGTNGTNGVMVTGSGSWPLGQTYSTRVTYDPASGAIKVYVNGTLLVNTTDPYPLPQGKYGFSATNSWGEFDNVTGTVQDDFDSYTVGTTAAGSLIPGSNWLVYYLDGTNDTAGISAAPSTLLPDVGQFNVTGYAATLTPSAKYKLYGTAGTTAVTGYGPSLLRSYLATTTAGTFTTTGIDASMPSGYTMPVDSGSFVTGSTGFSGGIATNTGRSRAATMYMFQQLHEQTQADLRKQLAETIDDDPIIDTSQPTGVQAPAKPSKNSSRPLRTRMPPAPEQQPVAPAQAPQYNGSPSSPPGDDDDISMLLQHL